MTAEANVREQLRGWIREHSKVRIDEFSDTTPILEKGILSSLDIVEFVLFIESLRGDEVDTDDIDPSAFSDVNSLYATFFANGA